MKPTSKQRCFGKALLCMLLFTVFTCAEVFSQNNEKKGPSWIFPLQLHPLGILWTGGKAPYTGAAKLHIAKVLGKKELYIEENKIFGPTIGIRYVNLDGNRWEGLLGLRYSARIFKTALPIDATWALDANVDTEKRVPLGISASLGLKQGPGGGLRFAYDVNHGDPLLEIFATVLVFGRPGKQPTCKPDLPDSGSFMDKIAFEAYLFLIRHKDAARQIPGDFPENLPDDVNDLQKFHDFLAGRGFPHDIISLDAMKKIIRDAGSPPQVGLENSRESVLGLLMGWREGMQILKCKKEV